MLDEIKKELMEMFKEQKKLKVDISADLIIDGDSSRRIIGDHEVKEMVIENNLNVQQIYKVIELETKEGLLFEKYFDPPLVVPAGCKVILSGTIKVGE